MFVLAFELQVQISMRQITVTKNHSLLYSILPLCVGERSVRRRVLTCPVCIHTMFPLLSTLSDQTPSLEERGRAKNRATVVAKSLGTDCRSTCDSGGPVLTLQVQRVPSKKKGTRNNRVRSGSATTCTRFARRARSFHQSAALVERVLSVLGVWFSQRYRVVLSSSTDVLLFNHYGSFPVSIALFRSFRSQKYRSRTGLFM